MNDCTTPACFSYRRRAAGFAPVRRYNATSARTLAVYLASSDNPEQSLCHNLSAHPSVLAKRRSTNASPKRTPGNGTAGVNGSVGTPRKSTITGVTCVTTSKRTKPQHPSGNHRTNSAQSDASKGKEPIPAVVPDKGREEAMGVLREAGTVDHRSFVQNVFNTTAFKMLEWLTPRSLNKLAGLEDADGVSAERGESASKIPENCSGSAPRRVSIREPSNGAAEDSGMAPDHHTFKDQATRSAQPTTDSTWNTVIRRSSFPKPPSAAMDDDKVNGTAGPKPRSNSMTAPISSHTSRKEDENEPVRGGFNAPTSPRALDHFPGILSMSRDTLPSTPIREISPQTEEANTDGKSVNGVTNTRAPTKKAIHSDNSTLERPEDRQLRLEREVRLTVSKSPLDSGTRIILLPQSLLNLSIETINLTCNVLQSDGTYEKHVLHPQLPTGPSKRRRNQPILRRVPNVVPPSPWLKIQWRRFIEQAFFDVLSKPSSLLTTFRTQNGDLLDSQTVWYLMFRLTRVAPSIVFHSLWMAAGHLFRAPSALTYDKNNQASNDTPLSEDDAAKVVTICLYALVAAAPLVTDFRQLTNMSRIRSFGLTMLGRVPVTLEPIAICLQYEDVFSNELALRLARRLFAAICVRRQYMKLQDYGRERPEKDVLDLLLDALKFLDLEIWSALSFTDQERGIHERRVPTLILDWARTVMLHDWQGSAEVPTDGPFGGALAVLDALRTFIYSSTLRSSANGH